MEQRSRRIRTTPNPNIAGAQALLSEMGTSRRNVTPYMALDIAPPMASDGGTLLAEQSAADSETSEPPASLARRLGGVIVGTARRINKPSLN